MMAKKYKNVPVTDGIGGPVIGEATDIHANPADAETSPTGDTPDNAEQVTEPAKALASTWQQDKLSYLVELKSAHAADRDILHRRKVCAVWLVSPDGTKNKDIGEAHGFENRDIQHGERRRRALCCRVDFDKETWELLFVDGKPPEVMPLRIMRFELAMVEAL